MKPGLFDLPNLRRGDTYPSFVIVNELRYSDGSPIPLSSAKLSAVDIFDRTVYTWSTENSTITISGANNNIVTLSQLHPVTTSNFPSTGANITYDLQVGTVSGETWTLLTGSVPVDSDITI